MLQHLFQLESADFAEEAIEAFFNNIDVLLSGSKQTNASNQNKIRVYYNNVRCITNKNNIAIRIELSIYDVFCLTETWLNESHSSHSYFPSNFNVFRCDRETGSASHTNRRSGGVAIAVRTKFKSQRIQQLKHSDCECLAVELLIKPTPLLLYVVYMRRFDADIASKHAENVAQLVSAHLSHRIIVLGDFNLYGIKWRPDETESYYLPSGLALHESHYHQGAA